MFHSKLPPLSQDILLVQKELDCDLYISDDNDGVDISEDESVQQPKLNRTEGAANIYGDSQGRRSHSSDIT